MGPWARGGTANVTHLLVAHVLGELLAFFQLLSLLLQL